jgi:hypothetical protein
LFIHHQRDRFCPRIMLDGMAHLHVDKSNRLVSRIGGYEHGLFLRLPQGA